MTDPHGSQQTDVSAPKDWALRAGVTFMLMAGLALVALLVRATNNRFFFERYYTPLLWANLIVAVLLVSVIVWGLWRLVVRLRSGKFGSRLLMKLAAIFTLVGVLPGLLIYVVSYQFVSRSIESWFDVKVEGALESGLTLARTSLETQAREFGNQLRAASQPLANTSDGTAALVLERLRAQVGASDASLWNNSGRLIASVGASGLDLSPSRPSPDVLRRLRGQTVLTRIEGVEDHVSPDALALGDAGQIRAFVSLGSSAFGLVDRSRVLQAVQPLPATLVRHALAVQEANREYQQRALGRDGLRRMYIGTLTLTLFLAIFGAVLLGVLLGKQLARPLLMLADGMRQVAAGDLRPKVVLSGRDELVGLTHSFADMTRQLADARRDVNSSMRQLESARTNLQTILDTLTAGVIVLDQDGIIRQINPGATRILRVPLAANIGKALTALPRIETFARDVQARFEAFDGLHGEHDLDHWQKAFELYAREGANTEALSLIVRGATMPGGLRLLVFDDISELVSAQRAQAWGEVARRLAHEIKNPLTPIQLAAERLQRRLSDHLSDDDRALLEKSVRTVVTQVDAMKRLVDEFRDYARLPAAHLMVLDLNDLVSDVLHFYGVDVSHRLPDEPVRVRFESSADELTMMGDAQQLRQVIHNLVQNALDASVEAETADGQADRLPPDRCDDVGVMIRTQRVDDGKRVRLLVADHGHGFSDAILKRACEPYVTTKAKGTGLGLAVVRKIMEEHHARLDISNRIQDGVVVGAQVSLTFEAAPHDDVMPTAS